MEKRKGMTPATAEEEKLFYKRMLEQQTVRHIEEIEAYELYARDNRNIITALSLLSGFLLLFCFTIIGQLHSSERQVEQLRWLNDHADYTMTQAQVDALHTCKQPQL